MRKSPCRRPRPQRVKIHRNYTIEEAAAILNIHKNTVRAWIRNGLPLIERKKPFLILGAALIDYVNRKNAAMKRPCGPGEMYCPPCRATKAPDGGFADYIARTNETGHLIGLCPGCGREMYRLVSWHRFEEVRGNLEVRITKPHLRIDPGTSRPVMNHIKTIGACDAA